MERWQNRVILCLGISDLTTSQAIFKKVLEGGEKCINIKIVAADSQENLDKLEKLKIHSTHPVDMENTEDIKNCFQWIHDQEDLGKVRNLRFIKLLKTSHFFNPLHSLLYIG
jgi:hypothetical protein